MRPAPPCTHRRLAEGECCRVDRCDHGTLHLSLGALTLRLSPEQLADLAETLATAARLNEPPSASRAGRLLC
jgi:hypothetical protein